MVKPTYNDGHQFRREDIMRLVLYYNATYSIGRSNYLRFEFSSGDCRIYLTGKYDFKNTYGIGLCDYNLVHYWHYDPDTGEKYPTHWVTNQDAGEFLVSSESDIETAFKMCEDYSAQLTCLDDAFLTPKAYAVHDDWKNIWHYLDYSPKAKKYQKKP